MSAALLCGAAASLASGCEASIPVPAEGPHTGDEPVPVPYPPPAARPEIIRQDKAEKSAVWIDGEWQWDGSRWVWQEGRWEVPYPGSYYAPPTGIRLADGRLLWFQGTWHSASDRAQGPRPSATDSPVNPPSPRSSTGVPLPTLPPGSELITSADAGSDASADAGSDAGAP